jgi:uncharacterized protein (TIGR02117 family)
MKKVWVLLVVLPVLWSCKSSEPLLNEGDANTSDSTDIYVAKHGWHTAIIIEKSTFDTLFPELTRFFPKAYYLDISWGDKKYFMAPKGTVPLALRAVLFPTNSVVRVMGYPERLKSYFSQNNIQSVRLSIHEVRQMTAFIKNTFKRDEDDKLIPVDKGDTFFMGDQKYWGIRTCNVWTARAVKRAGVSITPVFSLSADYVMKRIER